MRVLFGAIVLCGVAWTTWFITRPDAPVIRTTRLISPLPPEVLLRIAALERRCDTLAREVTELRAATKRANTPVVRGGPRRPAAEPTDRATRSAPRKATQRSLERSVREAPDTKARVSKIRAAVRPGERMDDQTYADMEQLVHQYGDASREGLAALYMLGVHERTAKEPERSDAFFERIRAAAGRDTKAHAEATFLLAWNRVDAGESPRAVERFEEVRRSVGGAKSTRAVAAYTIGYLHEQAGDKLAARVAYDDYLREWSDEKDGMVEFYTKLVHKRLKALE